MTTVPGQVYRYRIIATARRWVFREQRARWLVFEFEALGNREFRASYRKRWLGHEVRVERCFYDT